MLRSTFPGLRVTRVSPCRVSEPRLKGRAVVQRRVKTPCISWLKMTPEVTRPGGFTGTTTSWLRGRANLSRRCGTPRVRLRPSRPEPRPRRSTSTPIPAVTGGGGRSAAGSTSLRRASRSTARRTPTVRLRTSATTRAAQRGLSPPLGTITKAASSFGRVSSFLFRRVRLSRAFRHVKNAANLAGVRSS